MRAVTSRSFRFIRIVRNGPTTSAGRSLKLSGKTHYLRRCTNSEYVPWPLDAEFAEHRYYDVHVRRSCTSIRLNAGVVPPLRNSSASKGMRREVQRVKMRLRDGQSRWSVCAAVGARTPKRTIFCTDSFPLPSSPACRCRFLGLSQPSYSGSALRPSVAMSLF